MTNIDERYLKTGLRIQKDASGALELLSKEEEKLKTINKNLIKVTEELTTIKDTAKEYPNADAIKEDVFKQLNDIEIQSQILNKVIEPLNKRMERLRKEEEVLWDTVKEKYSVLKDDDIVKQFSEYIEKNQ